MTRVLSDECLSTVVCAMLGVNSYSPARVYDLLPQLRAERLLDAAHVAQLGIGPVTAALSRAGYNRGFLTGMLAERLHALMVTVKDGDLDGLESAVASGDKTKAQTLLKGVKGVGPRVADVAWKLLSA